MSLSFLGREHELLNARLRELIEECKIKKKLPKKVKRVNVPVKIEKYRCMLVFSPPAEVVKISYEQKPQVDVKMKAALVSLDNKIPENSGVATVRYNMSYEGFSQMLQLRGGTIVEISFANDMLPVLKKGMKKKAGNLNLNFPMKECFG